MEWTDRFDVTPAGRRLLNRAKDAIAAAATEPDRLDERPELVTPTTAAPDIDRQPATDCRQCNSGGSWYEIVAAIDSYTQARRRDRQ